MERNRELLAAKGDIFGGKADLFGPKGDPFAGKVDPFAGKPDPFAGKGDFLGKGDPFAAKGDFLAAKGDLLAAKGGDPFASKGDPFASKGDFLAAKGDLLAAKGDPLLPKGSDPFGPRGGDPFAGKGDLMAGKSDFLKGLKGPEMASRPDKGLVFDSLVGKGQLLGKNQIEAFAYAIEHSKGAHALAALEAAKGKSDLAKGGLDKPSPELMMMKGKGLLEQEAAAAALVNKGKGTVPNNNVSQVNTPPPPPPPPAVVEEPPVPQGQLATKSDLKCYDPKIGGNPGKQGLRWKACELDDYPFVIIRETKDVASEEKGRLVPNQICVQAGEMIILESGVVRMPIYPEGWVSVHARLLNGPTFLEMCGENEEKEIWPTYDRQEFLHFGQILGQQTLAEEHPMSQMRAICIPGMCRDHTETGKAERRAAREQGRRERAEASEANGENNNQKNDWYKGGDREWKNWDWRDWDWKQSNWKGDGDGEKGKGKNNEKGDDFHGKHGGKKGNKDDEKGEKGKYGKGFGGKSKGDKDWGKNEKDTV